MRRSPHECAVMVQGIMRSGDRCPQAMAFILPRFRFLLIVSPSWDTRSVSSDRRQRLGGGCAAGPARGAAERTGAWAS
jgi:hypothetical protein